MLGRLGLGLLLVVGGSGWHATPLIPDVPPGLDSPSSLETPSPLPAHVHLVPPRRVPFTVTAWAFHRGPHEAYVRRIDIFEVGNGRNCTGRLFSRTFATESVTLATAHHNAWYSVRVTWTDGQIYHNNYRVTAPYSQSVTIYAPY